MKYIFWLVIITFCCTTSKEEKFSEVVFSLANASYEMQVIDVEIKIDQFEYKDSLRYNNPLEKEIKLTAGEHILEFKSNAANIDTTFTFSTDSVKYLDLYHFYGLTEEELKTLEVVKREHNLDTAFFENEKPKFSKLKLSTSNQLKIYK